MERKFASGKAAAEKCVQIGKARDAWRELMLDVRTGEGEGLALPYAHLNFIKFEKNSLTLSFSSHIVTIEGENLRALYEALGEHSVRYVMVVEGVDERATPAEPVIKALDVVAVGQGDDEL